MVAEIEKVRSEFLQSVKEKDDHEKPSSRKRARRRNSIEYIKKPERDISDTSDLGGMFAYFVLCLLEAVVLVISVRGT